MGLTVLAPVTGQVVALADVPDPVFAGELVGPGLAIDPVHEPASQAVAPVGGVVVKLHAHAFVIQLAGDTPTAVLVHLGIDTVQLGGQGFTLHVAEGDTVAAGQPVISWDPAAIVAGGRSAICPVVALEAPPAAIDRLAEPGDTVAAGAPLLAWA